MNLSFSWTRRLAALALLAVLGLPEAARAQPIDVTSASIEEINRAFDDGTLTSEQLVDLYLARIDAYDKIGPTLNAVMTLNPRARERARELDAERSARGARSPLHGIPVVLKDNIDTADMPTTAGSSLLKESMPPDDAFIVQRLREAGAIILAKLNMSEFASGGAKSSLGGPHAQPTRHHPLARWIVRRHRDLRRGGLRAVRTGHRHRRIGADALDRERHRWPQANPRLDEP